MGIKIPTYEDRLLPEGFQNIRATAPDMTVNTADSQGMKAFGDAVSTFGSTQYHLERQRSNADNSTSAMADLAAVQNQVQKDIYDGVDKMGVGATLTGEDGQPVPFGQTMQSQVKARYDAVAQKYANATPEVKQFVARQIISSQASWNSEINSQAEKGAVVTRLAEFDKGLEQRAATAMANPQLHDDLIAKNKEAVANLGISPEARYQKLIDTQTRITNQAITALQSNPETNPQLLQSLQERVGNYKGMPDPFKSQPGQAAGSGVAASTDLGAIAPAIAGAEGSGKNPSSTASGKYQFIDSTFVAQAKASFPELKGKSNAEILALRGTAYNGQAIEEKMGTDFIAGNAQALQAANLPATGQNVYLAHFLGSAGAIKVLTADPNTPIEQITTADARAANPTILKPGMTAQNIINWAGNTINRQGGAAVAATGSQPGQPASAPATRQEVPGWIQNIVNQVPAANVNQALMASTSELQRQAQTMAAAFTQKQNDDIAGALAGKSPQNRLTQADFLRQHPYDGVQQYNNYAANLQAGEVINGIKTKSPGEALAAIEAYKPNFDAPGSAAAETRYNALKDAYAKIEGARQADPVQWSIDNKVGGAQPFKSSSPQDIAQELKTRAAVSDVMARTYNTDRSMLFTKNEAASFQKAFEAMPYDQRLKYLESIKDVITDPAQYLSVIQKIRPDSPVTAIQGALLMKDGTVKVQTPWIGSDISVTPFDVARMIGIGEDIRNPTSAAAAKDGNAKGFQLPKSQDFNQFFNDATGTIFRGQEKMREGVYQAVMDYWIAARVKEGDYKGEATGSQVAEAVKAVTGGVSKNYEVIMPWGMAEDRFKNELKAKFSETIKAAGMESTPLNNFDVMKLNPLADGKYMVVSGSGIPLIDRRTNQAMVLDLNNPNAMRQSVRENVMQQLNQTPFAPPPQGPGANPVLPGKTPAAPSQQVTIKGAK